MKIGLSLKKLSTLLLLLLLTAISSFAQEKTVTGTVTEESGEPLPGVTVIVKGTTQGTVTNSDGDYTLRDILEDATLQFSFVGMRTVEYEVQNQSVIDVTMEVDAIGIDEVVAVGYGTQKRSDITGSVASVKSEMLEEMPQVNLTQTIQGAIPGLSVNVNSNAADGNSNTILIRGRKSISGGNSPLIIVDGIPFPGSWSEINPNDVANIEVLKDASSAAIYGARAANGVILITTKSGRRGKDVKINYQGYYGIETRYELPDMMDPETYYQAKLERGINPITESEQAIYDAGEPVNWIEEVLRTGNRQQHNLSVSGGSKKAAYYLSGTYDNTKGIAKNDDFRRFSLQLNVDFDVTNWLTVGTKTNLTYRDISGDPANFNEAFRLNPFSKIYEEDGKTLTIFPLINDPFFSNPLSPTLRDDDDRIRSVNTINYARVKLPLEGLEYMLNTGFNNRFRLAQQYRDRSTSSGYNNNGLASIGNSTVEEWTVENILNYKRDFGMHNIFVTLLYSAQGRNARSNNISGTEFPNDVMASYGIGTAGVLEASAGYTQSNHVSQMGRINYSYNEKYLLTLTTRRDGYSAFGENTKYGIFPSAAIGWNIGRESFLEDQEWITNLKLRASYGANGNEAVNPYITLARLSQADYVDENGKKLVGYYPNRLSNPLLGWEQTEQTNFGIDFGLADNRIQGSIDYYMSNTTDLLLSKSIPPINGTTSITENLGQTEAKGIELQVSSVNVNNGDFKWTTDVTFESSRSEIVDVALSDSLGNPMDDIGSRWFIGEPIQVNFGYEKIGIWQLDEVEGANPEDMAFNQAGDIKYRDVNGDGKIDTEDRKIIGSRIPDFTMGLNNTLKYKNWSLNFFLYTVQGITKRNPLITTNDWDLRLRMYDFNYWTPENPTDDYPRNATAGEVNQKGALFYEDASFIRLRNVTLSYDFPKNISSDMGLQNLELYVNAKNLFTITDWRGIDPEFTDQTNRPQTRIFMFGARIGL